MKRIFIFILLSVFFFVSYAQTQSGYVRTLGRPDKKGEPLSGVSIRVKGEHNTVLSNEDGNFSLLLTGKKNGDAYSLQQVVKSGYELNESGMIGRPYAFSDKIPLTIVMVSTAQLQAEKIRIENNAYRVAENNYKLRLASLEKQKEEKSITAEEYRKEIQDLQDKFEKYQSLIGSLAEHYAHTDYDVLNETEHEINLCIENGDLERADSLIHTLFNPVDVLKRNSESLARIDRNIRQANEIIRQANEDMAAVLKQQAKDAEYLFQLYTISLARFDKEKATRYIETRAQLDTTNVYWQLDAANFLRKYMADYPKAMSVYKKALHHAMEQSGNESQDVALCYICIAIVYEEQGYYDKALEYQIKSLQIKRKIFGEQDLSVAISLSNIGNIYGYIGNYEEALTYLEKAIDIEANILGDEHPALSTFYNNIAYIYNSQGKYEEALRYYLRSLSIRFSFFGKKHPEVAESYNNIGHVYFSQGDYDTALEYYQESLSMWQTVYGEQHPYVAKNYNNIGAVYSGQGDYVKALEYYQKALSIQQAVFGKHHPDVASSYNNIGYVYGSQRNYEKALEYYQKSLSIYLSFFGEKHPDVARSYNNIGGIYDLQGNKEKALEYFRKALPIQQAVFGEQHPDVALSYSNIGSAYNSMGNSREALSNLQKSLSIYLNLYGNNDAKVLRISALIHNIYYSSLKQSPELKKEFKKFISDYAYTLIIDKEKKYYLIEYNNWHLDSEENILDHYRYDIPADIVLMHNGKIGKFHSDNTKGCEVGLKYVGKEEKERILKEYNSWKNKNSN